MPASFFDHLDLAHQRELPSAFRHVLQSTEVDVSSGVPSAFQFKTAHIGDWWLAAVDGLGSARITGGGVSSIRDDDRVVLALTYGGGWHRLLRERSSRIPGSLMLVRRDHPHGYSGIGDLRALSIDIPQAELIRAGEGQLIPFNRSLSSHHGPGAVIAATARMLAHEAFRGRTDTLRALCPDFSKMVLNAFRSAHEDSPTESRVQARLDRIAECLRDNFEDPNLTPEMVASLCGISTRQMFRDYSGNKTTFSGSLRRVRLESAAAQLIAKSSVPISDIAYANGFKSVQNFGALFRTTYGISPRDFRKTRNVEQGPWIDSCVVS